MAWYGVSTCFLLAMLVSSSLQAEDVAPKATECPGGWTLIPGTSYCYYKHDHPVDRLVTWTEARDACEAAGGTLPASKEMMEMVTPYVKFDNYYWLWIGISDSETEGTWKWLNGSPMVDPDVWMTVFRPSPPRDTRNCAAMDSYTPKAAPYSCDSKYLFICVREAQKKPAKPCPEGWTQHVADVCIQEQLTKMLYTRDSADAYCQGLGVEASLPEFENVGEMVLSGGWTNLSLWWNQLTDRDVEGKWENDDGSQPTGLRWHIGGSEPTGTPRDNCMVSDKFGYLLDVECDYVGYSTICMIKQGGDKPPPKGDKKPGICKKHKKEGTLDKYCKTTKGQKNCAESCKDVGPGEIVDEKPDKCLKMKADGTLTEKFCKKQGQIICAKTCSESTWEVTDKKHKLCQKWIKKHKLTEKFCKGKKGKKLCKKSCENPQKERDLKPKMCEILLKNEPRENFKTWCKSKAGKKQCRETCTEQFG